MSEFKPNSEIGEPTCGCTRRLVFHISEGIRKINEQPTVDAEPVIRCKDCKYWADGYCDDSLIEGLERKVSRFEDDFCSRGELK